jgi:long-chain acyl-CoA synthetase
MAESIAEFFLEHFRANELECAYVQRRGYRTQKVTYAQVLDRAFVFGQELERRAIGKSDRIMLWAENSAEWAAVFFGCALRGTVVVPMDDGASADFARRVCGQVDARLVVTSRPHREAVADLAVPILGLEDLPQARQDLVTSNSSDLPGRDDILQIVFTSGTTADPKGVVITHGNVLANIAPLEKEIRAHLKYERFVHPVRFLSLLPLSHVFGQFLGMFLPPLMGGTVIFQSELKPSEVMNTIRRERVSVLVSVPRVLQSLKHKVERDLEDRGQIEEFRRRFAGAKEKHPFRCAGGFFRADSPALAGNFGLLTGGAAPRHSDTEEFWGVWDTP